MSALIPSAIKVVMYVTHGQHLLVLNAALVAGER